jgi:hypothetical protein
MNRRIPLAGLPGGIAMFVWSSLAHMALPFGQAGIREIPNDLETLNALHGKLGDASGFYLFPATGLPSNASFQQRNAAMADCGRKLATELPVC